MKNRFDKFMLESLLEAKGTKNINSIIEEVNFEKYLNLTTFNEDEIAFIYQKILTTFDNNYKAILFYLISSCLKTNLINNQDFLDKLTNFTEEEVIIEFHNNLGFARTIINGYFSFIKNPQDEYSKKVPELLFKYDRVYKMTFIDDYIRYLIHQILLKTNNYYSAATLITTTFYDNMRVAGDKQLLELASEIKKYPNILSKLIYADIYEDIMARCDNENNNSIIKQTVLMAINEKDYMLPLDDFNKTKMLIIYFVFLNSLNEIRKQNRLLLNAKSINTLKEINPLFVFEESDIIGAR